MNLVTEQAAILLDACALITHATSNRFIVTGGELVRPIEMQQLYVKSGRSKTMDSQHLKRLAIDLNFFKDGKLVATKSELAVLGEFWESLNPANRWGGNFKSLVDTPHFERNIP